MAENYAISGPCPDHRFHVLASQWARETGHIASLSIRKQHPAYLSIVRMGRGALPLLLECLTTSPDILFPALREISGENPVRDEDRGNYDRMAAAWQQWGRDRHLIA